MTLNKHTTAPFLSLCQLSFNKSKYLQNGGKNYEYDPIASFVDMVVKKNVEIASAVVYHILDGWKGS